jgi:hypothetical protein
MTSMTNHKLSFKLASLTQSYHLETEEEAQKSFSRCVSIFTNASVRSFHPSPPFVSSSKRRSLTMSTRAPTQLPRSSPLNSTAAVRLSSVAV